ncbi:aspartate/glutamate racemase family protein [Rhizobium mayense]|uniref:Amino acid racemase n=1 Tax=Rhizobium mayense TaxID=1312184 RepID=A0ABT7JSP5_9HYPH|nr:amino acid racemase [Rhizobium mayense]MDL2398927.1 amino acid racemase [Rhizobium mayense]
MVLRRVGILGGMGPEATVLLMQKVLAAVKANDDADHIPLLVDQNPQVPSRLQRLIEGTGEDPGPVLADMARRLQAAGAEALAMPCNTAHHFVPAISAATSVPFLNMVELSVRRARQLAAPGGRVGILASPAVRRIKLFESALAAAELQPVYHDDEAALLWMIRRLKAEGPNEEVRARLMAASEALLAQGADVQMIACTEYSLIADAVASDAKVFDTLDCLTEAIVHFSTTDQTQ